MGFQDKFNTNFSRVSIDATDLKIKFASLLVILLLERLRYNYLIGAFVMERDKLVTILARRLFSYSRYRVSQFLGSSHLFSF